MRAWQFKVCTSHAVHYSYNGFKYVLKEHSCFVCNRGDTVSRQSPIKRVRPSPYTTNSVFLIPRQALSSHWHQWMVWLQDRIEIVCQIGTLSTILQHCTHTQWNRDPLLLTDGTLRCWIYPTGKVVISCHLATPGFPMTILSASSVRTLVHCVVMYSRPPDLKSSSNVSPPFPWTTGPATDPR